MWTSDKVGSLGVQIVSTCLDINNLSIISLLAATTRYRVHHVQIKMDMITQPLRVDMIL
jgi:hypothetical protein